MIVNVAFEVVDHEGGATAPDAKRMVELLHKVIPEAWWLDRDTHWTLVEIRPRGEDD